MKSSDFRKQYARLTEAVEVTVNGHIIGRWEPWTGPSPLPIPGLDEGPLTVKQQLFRPVPKPSKRR